MKRFIAPLAGLSVFALASGYLMTLVPLRLNTTHDSEVLAGYIGAVYYLGLLAGSFRAEKVVSAIGHIRSFAAFMALLCASVLSLAFSENMALWLLLRFVNGLAVAGIFVVVESWLLSESNEHNRGRIIAFYMVSLYGANAVGQLFVGLIDSATLMPFILIGTLLALSIIPTTVTRIPTPEIEAPSTLNFVRLYQLSPSGVIGCLTGGMVLGALYSLLPIYLLNDTTSNHSVGVMLGITMIGGMLLQYPVGYCSDFIDRRKVLVTISAIGCIACLLIVWLPMNFWLQALLLFVIGGATFSLYPLAISHGCDHMQPEDIVAGTQGLLLAYSSGACIGPIIGAYVMNSITDGLMLFFVVIMGFTGLFFLVRIPARPQIYSSDEQPFVPVPRTTPVMAQIDPRGETEDFVEE